MQLVPPSPSLRPFFPYYGGKWRFARRYPSPRYRRIVEPFAGSAGYSVRYSAHRVELNDAFGAVVDTWTYLAGADPHQISALPDILLDQTVDLVPLAARPLVGWWLNKAKNRPCRSPSAWMRAWLTNEKEKARRPVSYWGAGVRQRLAEQIGAIRHWQVSHGSYESLDTSQPATWFIDPPYQRAGAHYPKGSQQIDFAHLADWCRSLRGQIIVCENEGAEWLPFLGLGLSKATHGHHRRGKSRECVFLANNP